MATSLKDKKKKKKPHAVSGKDKLGKVSSKNKLSPSSSKLKKKKKKKRVEQEEVIAKKKKSVVLPKSKYDDDDIGEEDDDIVQVDDIDDSDDTEEGDDESSVDVEDETPVHDLGKVDPGPEVSEVACGFNCGSCNKFVKLDDPIRKDPEWLSSNLEKRSKLRCPFLFPDEIEVPENKSIHDFVMRADSKACDHFHFNEDRATENLTTVLNIVRAKLDRDEIDVVSHLVDRVRGMKADEDKHGYQLGEQMRIRYKTLGGDEVTVRCEVIEFQRKKGAEVIVRPLSKIKGVPSRLAISARRAIVVD